MVMDKAEIQAVLEKALAAGRQVLYEGKVASYIPELAKANSGNLGVCLMRKDGTEYCAGDYDPLYHAKHFQDLFPDPGPADRRV